MTKPSALAGMLLIAFASSLAVAFAVAFAAPTDARPKEPPKDPPGESADDLVINIGHRGASGHAPEHTIPAYDLAKKMGADYIEQDLQLTRDGVLVALHDETLDRTARGPAENCTGLVRGKTLAQIKTCDVGSWFNEAHPERAKAEYVGLKIPTLEEVFQRYRSSANYYIETKSPEAAPGMEEELLRLMEKYKLTKPAEERWQVLIQSFSPASLQKTSAMNPDLPLIQLYARSGPIPAATLDAAATYAVGVGPSKDDVDAALTEAARARCLDVHPYTVNETAEMEALIAAGVDGMFTNFPDRLEMVLGKNAAPGKTGAMRAAKANEACRNRTLPNLAGGG